MKKTVIAVSFILSFAACSDAASSSTAAETDSAAAQIPGVEDTTKRVTGPITLKRQKDDTGRIVLLQDAINATPKDTAAKK